MIYRLSEIFQKISKKISVCNLTKRSTLPLLFFGEILKNGWHSLSWRFPRKHSSWNHFSIIATLNSHYVYLKKDSTTKKFSKMDGFLRLLIVREMLIAFPGLKLNITFSKHFLPICNQWMEWARSCYSKPWKFGYFQKQYPLDPPQDIF